MRNAYSYAPYRDQIEARDRARWLGGTASANVKPKHQNDAIASPDHQDKPEVLLGELEPKGRRSLSIDSRNRRSTFLKVVLTQGMCMVDSG